MTLRQRSRRNSCTAKVSYGTWAKALADARRVNMKHDECLAPYACTLCGSIHNGHVDPAHKDRRPRDA